MIFRTVALFSLFSWAAALANPLATRDLPSSIEVLRFTADSITRDSAVFWQYPLASSANVSSHCESTPLFKAFIPSHLLDRSHRRYDFQFRGPNRTHTNSQYNHVRRRRRQHTSYIPGHLLRHSRRLQRALHRLNLLCTLRARPDALLLNRMHPSGFTHLSQRDSRCYTRRLRLSHPDPGRPYSVKSGFCCYVLLLSMQLEDGQKRIYSCIAWMPASIKEKYLYFSRNHGAIPSLRRWLVRGTESL
ncbi:hypothetical protein IW262DRAFT_839826 [Armillaria fumosa]|nr:hypothetical protein IW262DRAFT_839826 [Armillaria fumosa]